MNIIYVDISQIYFVDVFGDFFDLGCGFVQVGPILVVFPGVFYQLRQQQFVSRNTLDRNDQQHRQRLQLGFSRMFSFLNWEKKKMFCEHWISTYIYLFLLHLESLLLWISWRFHPKL